MRWLLSGLVLSLALAAPSFAQDTAEEDRGWLTEYLEETFSDVGRDVRIDGFAGALSARATMDRMTFSDANGIWLTLNDVTLDWNRSALLSGQVEVAELTAAEIIVARRPLPADGLPAPEASAFALPDLPVSVQIDTIRADRVSLGAGVIGPASELALEGTASLAEGEGSARLTATRIDDIRGDLRLQGSFSNESRILSLDLSLDEAAGGIAANLTGIPGQPALALSVKGSAPVDDFTADIVLASDGTERLRGTARLGAEQQENEAPTRRFDLDVTGDIAPLFAPDYRDFFGDRIALKAGGIRLPDGETRLDTLSIAAQALTLTGSLRADADGVLQQALLSGQLGGEDGAPVTLPLSGPVTDVRSGSIDLQFDAAASPDWGLSARLDGFTRPDLSLDEVSLTGRGRIDPATGGMSGNIGFDAAGVHPADTALAAALGDTATGNLDFVTENDAVTVHGVTLSTPTLDLTANGRLAGLGNAFTFTGAGNLVAADLVRFSALAGRPLSGSVTITATGSASPLTGAFDLDSDIVAANLTLAEPRLDALLRGQSTIHLSARRDDIGTLIRELTLQAATLRAAATGLIASDNRDLTADLDFTDLSALGPGYGGALTATARLTGEGDAFRIQAKGTGQSLRLGNDSADRLLAGQTALTLDATAEGGNLAIRSFDLTNPQLSARAGGSLVDGRGSIDIDARLADLALLVPEFPGPLTVTGQLTSGGTDYGLALDLTGPGGTDAHVQGSIAPDLTRADLGITGRAQAGLANPFIAPRAVQGPLAFDLRLNGPLRLASLSGRVSTAGARLSDDTTGLSLSGIDASADLSGGNARITAGGAVNGGGRAEVQGTIGIAPPNTADLSLQLESARLRDSALYDARISGNLALAGPLAGGARISGALRVDEAELRLPDSGGAASFAFPDLRHVNDSGPVRLTRQRAGLDSVATGAPRSAATGPTFPLDVTVTAPGQVFIRGRGLDAELGGTVRLTGSTANVVPSGEFALIRGRLDLLGKRFTLDEGSAELRGALSPHIRLTASTEADGVTSAIVIEGDAAAPQISFTSSPPLPEEEVVARLLFGRGLSSLSPLQAAQLASAIATLSGKGGAGIIDKLRQGAGLDDLDVTTTEDGAAQLRLGKYLSDNLYTDVEVASDGTSAISLNLDVTESLTVKGTLDSGSGGGIGVFYERDY
ncbi:MAG: translocation/assembly module TamB domain-containing protein [Paracoccaceae bacterium]